jgi:hypothetical protein
MKYLSNFRKIVNRCILNGWLQRLVSRREKTDITARIPLLPAAINIIDQYADHPQCQESGRVLPVSSNQKMNAYLKEIADLCGIQIYSVVDPGTTIFEAAFYLEL